MQELDNVTLVGVVLDFGKGELVEDLDPLEPPPLALDKVLGCLEARGEVEGNPGVGRQGPLHELAALRGAGFDRALRIVEHESSPAPEGVEDAEGWFIRTFAC